MASHGLTCPHMEGMWGPLLGVCARSRVELKTIVKTSKNKQMSHRNLQIIVNSNHLLMFCQIRAPIWAPFWDRCSTSKDQRKCVLFRILGNCEIYKNTTKYRLPGGLQNEACYGSRASCFWRQLCNSPKLKAKPGFETGASKGGF